MYKVVTYVPTEYLDKVLSAIKSININKIGEYTNCVSYLKTTSSWNASSDAKPFIGTPEEETKCEEYRVEFVCESNKLKEIAAAIRKVHPYEAVEIDAYPVALL